MNSSLTLRSNVLVIDLEVSVHTTGYDDEGYSTTIQGCLTGVTITKRHDVLQNAISYHFDCTTKLGDGQIPTLTGWTDYAQAVVDAQEDLLIAALEDDPP